MSLKALHLVFVNALSALTFGCAIWKIRDYLSPSGRGMDLLVGIAAILSGIAVILYGRYFLKKLKTTGYL
jgi:hypothetical protein